MAGPSAADNLRALLPHLNEDEAAVLAAGGPPPALSPDSGVRVATTRPSGCPKVSCLLTAVDPARHRFWSGAVRAFRAQDWPNKELVVVDATGLAGSVVDGVEGVVEVKCPPGPPGALKNRGAAAASGDYLLPWDDDDLHAPALISYLAAAAAPGRAACLARQLRLHLAKGRAALCEPPGGVAAALLTPRGGPRWREELPFAEDLRLFAYWRGRCTAVDNVGWERVALYHGDNQAPESLFFPAAFCRPAPPGALAGAAPLLQRAGLGVTTEDTAGPGPEHGGPVSGMLPNGGFVTVGSP